MRNVLCLLFVCLLQGCDNQAKLHSHLADYQSRLAKVLDKDIAAPNKVNLSPYPALKQLQTHQSQQSIKLFEFYQLKGCELYSLVAERNTALGKMQLPSTRYIYERKLLIALQDCIDSTTDNRLQDLLVNWQANKQTQIKLAWRDVLQLSSETKLALSSNSGYIQGNQQDGIAESQQAWRYLVELEQNNAVSSEQLERHLQLLRHHLLPAKMWLSQMLLDQYLRNLTPWLASHTQNLNCQLSRDKQTLTYLTNVFQLFFIEKIQPIAGKLNYYHHQLARYFTTILNQPQLSAAFKNRIKHYHFDGFHQYQQAMQQHIQFWQGLYKGCGMPPGKPKARR